MINYANEEVNLNGCLACAYVKNEFILPCGMAYQNDRFTLSQDWELPIQGFFVVSPTRHIENFEELSKKERIEIFEIVNKTIKILKSNNICDRFNVIFEEKQNVHFHVWIMPRHKWMNDLVGNISNNIGKIFEYAKTNLNTPDNLKKINEITQIIKEKFM